jgi:NAD(P)H-hydrate epimerase
MNVLSAAQIKELDRRAVEEGIPESTLMETAGGAVAKAIERRTAIRKVVVIAGTGGNGGDALVAARRLYEMGIEVRAFTIAPLNNLSPLTKEKADLLCQATLGSVSAISEDLVAFEEALSWGDCVIDGLLGIGVDRPLQGRYEALVRAINRAQVIRVTVDLPSGLTADRGTLLGEAVKADLTVCMAAYKPAHLLYPAREFCGEIEVVPVGYPPQVKEEVLPIASVVERDWVHTHLPIRPPNGHKGAFGRVLIVAGSTGMSGAAILCAKGALRAGAGLITLASPSVLNPILEVALPEVITIPLPDEDGHLTEAALDRLVPVLDRANLFAVGPGLSRDPAVGLFVLDLLKRVEVPVVIDADGLFPLADNLDLLERLSGRAVLTPHPGELAHLLGRPAEEIDQDRIEVVRAFAREHGIVLLLKGRPTAIGTPEGEVYLNPTGNTGLATGGSGDVLTGLIAGLMAGGATPTEGAILGAYLHGATADLLARDRAERSIIPSDLIDALPYAIAEVKRC